MLTELIFNVEENYKYLYLLPNVSKASAKRHISVCASVSKALVQASAKRSCKHRISVIYLQTGAVEGTASWHSILCSISAWYLAQYSARFGAVWHSSAQFGTVFSCRSLRFLRVLHNNFGGNLYHCVAIVLGYNVTQELISL